MSDDSTRGKQLQKKNSSRSTNNSLRTEDIPSDWKTQTKTSEEKVSRHLGQNTNVRTTLPLPAPITRMVRSHQNGQQVHSQPLTPAQQRPHPASSCHWQRRSGPLPKVPSPNAKGSPCEHWSLTPRTSTEDIWFGPEDAHKDGPGPV